MGSPASPPRVKSELSASTKTRPRAPADDADEVFQGEASDANLSDGGHQAKRIKTDRKRKGRASAEAEDEQDEQDEEGDEDQQQQQDDQQEEEEDFSHEKQQLIRDDTGYVTGSIVRIACHSFLTYDHVEFRPGPQLNMIIGPNGTGKSTIACAIAIGLGFPAKVLGRSTKLAQYCKNDSNKQTWIELELKGKPGKKNLTVRRMLSRDSEKTSFKLNGDDATLQQVKDHMEELQVQVGNLCTFLPQDRVASFAMMTPSELLRETQKAAGHPQLAMWHELLIAEYKTCKDAQADVDRLSEKFKRVQTKQAETEKEVRAFEQRERMQQDLDVIEILVKFAHYLDVYKRHQIARQSRTEITNEVQELEARNKPFKDSKALLKEIVAACEREQGALQKKVQQALKDASSKENSVKRLDDEREKVAEAIQGIKKDDDMRKETIKKYLREIERLQSIVDNEPPETDTREIARQITGKSQEKNNIAAEMAGNKDRQDQIYTAGGHVKNDLDRLQQELDKNQQVHRIREANCAHYDKETWAAVQWYRQNQHKMKGRVWEPARFHLFPKKEYNGIRINLADKTMLNLVEAPVTMAAFSMFLFEFREDYDFMFRELHDAPLRDGARAVRLNGCEIDVNRTVADYAQSRPYTPEQMNALGLDAYAIDLLEGPEAQLAWLCEAHNLHRVPLQLKRREVNAQAIEQSRAVRMYYTPDGSYSIKSSMYGRRAVQLENRALQQAKILGASVDPARLENLNERIKAANSQRQGLKDELDKLKVVNEELRAQAGQIEQERRELQDIKEKQEQDRRVWMKAGSKLKTMKQGLQNEKNKPRAEDRRAKLNERLRAIMDKRVRLALEYKDFVERAADKQEQSIKINLQALQADSDHRAMESMVREKDEELESKKAELEEIKIEVQALAQQGKQLIAVANDANDEASDETKERAEQRRQEEGDAFGDLEKLEGERDELHSSLNCMTSVSPMVMEAYNKRKAELAECEGRLGDAQEKLDDSNSIIDETKNRWLPRLKRLIGDVSAKFTSSFDTLGLLGEVRLNSDPEDYEKWGIEIMVSFRDRKDDSADVTLHVLSGHRQSGGERALTTVTYLLALAELARAPFALVDEINQGMDQRAERNMHKMLVETTCKDDVGQYFLLTPKLLPDLVYHPKMKVLVINVSPWIPEGLNLRDMVETKKRLRMEKAAVASGGGRAIAVG